MKVIPFPRKPQITLERESCSVDIALYLDSRPWSLILFIDRQQLCLDYAAQPWVATLAPIVEVDEEIMKEYNVTRVPKWAWFLKDREIHHLGGSATDTEVLESDAHFKDLPARWLRAEFGIKEDES